MEDYKPNSKLYKEKMKKEASDKKVEKVVKGKVKVKKKNKFADLFISEDANNVKDYIFLDVLVPAIKKAISDIVTDGIDIILYGGSGNGRKRSSSGSISYTSYSRFSDRFSDRDRRDDRRSSIGYRFNDIIFDDRREAKEVLERLDELIDNYGKATVADFYDLVDISGNYTDNRYGWTSLRNADIVSVRDGWMIKLPKALVLD